MNVRKLYVYIRNVEKVLIVLKKKAEKFIYMKLKAKNKEKLYIYCYGNIVSNKSAVTVAGHLNLICARFFLCKKLLCGTNFKNFINSNFRFKTALFNLPFINRKIRWSTL